ncbi:MAG: tRNA (adenosine(37)-N6)-threonylcarbamoyltransferase complex ATPase subunit type 1 TsaE [Candidatus Hydrogenedentes bacterium]|nr:tRNA (adenosine(37)-N6)-threonylcarbamoyltransferase complex ATPase subunit type 1 TsaE [Candidatus Hydrogenedentota bacterium]
MSGAPLVITTASAEETEALGGDVAHLLPGGGTLALRGDLASGKTCFVRGMARAIGGAASVHSPTFTLVNEYKSQPVLYHMDLYRLTGPEEVADLGCEEIFDSDALCVVEWAERADPLLPPRRLDILFEHAGGDLRRITFADSGLMPEGWESRLLASKS